MANSTKYPVVSICIPVFNGDKFIQDCLRSVLDQSFVDFEILVVDNASTDKTLELCSAFDDQRIHVYRNESNIGAQANFKKCFELAQGEFVMLLPCDDILYPKCLELLAVPLMENINISLAVGKTTQIDVDGEFISEPSFKNSGYLNREDALKFLANNFNPIQHPLVRRKSYFEQGEFLLQYGAFMDIRLWTAIIFSRPQTFVSSEQTSAIRCHPNQGQNIMSNLNERTMAAAAAHFGDLTLKQYRLRFGLNLSYLRYVRFFIGLDKQYMAESGIDKIMLSKLIQSNLNALLLNLLRGKRSQLNFELMVARRVFGEFNRLITAQIYVREFLRIGIKELRNMTKRSSG
jgi:glycosyltransferase involved in cell wall biosynthesis